MNANETLIKVENLQKYYKGGEIKALDGINTEIKKGEVVVVIGPSGSGKSTFLRCLNLLEVPTGGNIFFEGIDITDEKTNINKLIEELEAKVATKNINDITAAQEELTKAWEPIAKRIYEASAPQQPTDDSNMNSNPFEAMGVDNPFNQNPQ